MPAHSSHKLQPLDVGCFAPLKVAYGHQIEWLMRTHINHITKLEFLSAFREAFFIAMTAKNALGGWAGSGLVPYDPERVISRLDVQLRTPTPPGQVEPLPSQWSTKTPHNAIEANSQQELIKARIQSHQNSSPTTLLTAVDQLAKGATAVMHQMALLRTEVTTLHKANAVLSRRRRAKKTRIPVTGALSIQEAQDLLDQKAVEEQLAKESRRRGSRPREAGVRVQSCSRCKEAGHNARTCKKAVESSNSATPNVIMVDS
jgi:DDE superfamily endonuclease